MYYLIQDGGEIEFELENQDTGEHSKIEDDVFFEEDTTVCQIKEYIKEHILKDKSVDISLITISSNKHKKLKDDQELEDIQFNKVLYWKLRKEEENQILKPNKNKATIDYGNHIYEGEVQKKINSRSGNFHYQPFGKGEVIYKNSLIIIKGWFNIQLITSKRVEIIYPNNFKYIGFIDSDYKRNGKGIIVNTKSNVMTQGEFINDKITQATITYPDRNIIYTGKINSSTLSPDGNGIMRVNGDVFNGLFSNGFIITGTLMTDHLKYIGEFRKNVPNGNGSLEYKKGTKSRGIYQTINHQIYLIEGDIKYPDGTKTIGNFHHNELEGKGYLEKPDGKKYSGVFKNGWLEEPENIVYPNGDVYFGEFDFPEPYINNPIPDGTGSLVYPDGDTVTGIFQDGTLIEPIFYQKKDGSQYSEDFYQDEQDRWRPR